MFLAGNQHPINKTMGTIITYDYTIEWNETEKVLETYDGNNDVLLTLPTEMKTGDIAWLSIWCRPHRLDLGHVLFKGKL